MKVIDLKPIGYQKVIDTRGIQKDFYQLRYFAIVEKIGEFVSDPAGKVDQVILADPKNYKQYFNWGEIGESIINRALKFKANKK